MEMKRDEIELSGAIEESRDIVQKNERKLQCLRKREMAETTRLCVCERVCV